MEQTTVHPSPLVRGFRWLSRMGLLVPILCGLALMSLAFMSVYTDPGFRAPSEVNAGAVDTFPVAEPRFFEEHRFWVVKLPSGDVLGLYDRDPLTGCTVPWQRNYELMGRTGWFRDACSASTYDLQGACFNGPCTIGLNRMKTEIVDGNIIVYLREQGSRGPARSEYIEPITP
jgi:hypothetical protein